jgi:hypothetical protein
MNTRHRLIAAFLRVYPVSWRQEYGAELEDVLLARPLTAGIVVNVLWNGLRQRVRATEPATILGIVMMAIVTGQFAFSSDPVLLSSEITWPPLVVSVLNPSTELYALLLMACGGWTNLKYGGRIGRSAWAAIKLTFIAGIPVMLAGALMLARVEEASPRVAVATLVAPLVALPYSGLWGAVGGSIGRRLSYLRRRFARS